MPDKNKLETNDLTKQTLEDELSPKENHALIEGNTQHDDGKGQVNEGASTSGIPHSMKTPKKDERKCVSPVPTETCSEYDSSDLYEWSSHDRAVLGNMSNAMASTTREVERKNRKQLSRATSKASVGVRDAYENEQTKCGRCSEYVVKIVQLKKKYKGKKGILKQENEKLKSQLSGRNQTDLLLQHILDENKDFKHKNTRCDFEDKLKLSEEKLQEAKERNIHLKYEIDSVVTDRIKIKQELNEKVQGLEKDKKSLSDEVCDLKKEYKNSMEKMDSERQGQHNVLSGIINTLQEENKARAEKIAQLELEVKQQRAALETLSAQLRNVTDERDIDTVQLEMVADERDTVIEERDRVTTQLEAVAEERDRVTTRLEAVTEEQDRVTTRLDTVLEERDRATTRLEAVAEEQDRVTAQLEAVTEERDRVTTELEAVAEERDSVTTQLEAVAEERVRVATQFNTLTEERDRVTTQLNTVTEERDRVTAQLEAVTDDRDRVTTQLERTQTHNVALLDVINQFQERMQVFEAPAQDDQALRNELPEMDIFVLPVEQGQVHVPD